MPGIYGPTVFVSASGRRLIFPRWRFAHASTFPGIARISCFLVVMLAGFLSAAAQGSGDLTDVHIAPRPQPAAAATAVAAPNATAPSVGLKTTDHPIKVDVNLVLVPVTVTDPMNRL